MMKKIIFYCLSLLFLGCGKDTIAELSLSNTNSCNDIFKEMSHIRIDRIGHVQYKYDNINGVNKLVEIKHDNVSTYFTYNGDEVDTRRSLQRNPDIETSYEEYIYSNGYLSRINNYIFPDIENRKKLIAYTTLIRDDSNRIIHRKSYDNINGEDELESQCIFEWDDCNVTKAIMQDKNGTVGTTLTYFYDDKINPYNLVTNHRFSAHHSTNNLVGIENVNSNDPNFLLDSSYHTGLTKWSFIYNEFDLPIKKVAIGFDDVDFTYIID